MTMLMCRIALDSDIQNGKLQKMFGKKYVCNVELIKSWLSGLDNAEYALIIHDDSRKPHLHLVLCSELTESDLRVYFPIGYVEKCRYYDASLLYLLHRGHPDLKQYKVSDLYTNINYLDHFPFLRGC